MVTGDVYAADPADENAVQLHVGGDNELVADAVGHQRDLVRGLPRQGLVVDGDGEAEQECDDRQEGNSLEASPDAQRSFGSGHALSRDPNGRVGAPQREAQAEDCHC